MDEADCEHLFNAAYCDHCGGYLGEACEFCGFWTDGGDWMASRDDLWCRCLVSDHEADLRRQAADPYAPDDPPPARYGTCDGRRA